MAKNRTLNVIYMGDRVGKGDMQVSMFRHGKQDLVFKKVPHCQIGTTYELEQTPEGQYVFPRFLNESKKQKDVSEATIAEWELEHQLAKDELAMIRERKKIKNNSDFLKCLEPIAKMYSGASKHRKLAIELAVIRQLRSYFKGQGWLD